MRFRYCHRGSISASLFSSASSFVVCWVSLLYGIAPSGDKANYYVLFRVFPQLYLFVEVHVMTGDVIVTPSEPTPPWGQIFNGSSFSLIFILSIIIIPLFCSCLIRLELWPLITSCSECTEKHKNEFAQLSNWPLSEQTNENVIKIRLISD